MTVMEPEFYQGRMWVVTTDSGVGYYPASLFTRKEVTADLEPYDLIEEEEGWWARLSEPGCLDCTEWIGPCESAAAARAELAEAFNLCPECLGELDEDYRCPECEGEEEK